MKLVPKNWSDFQQYKDRKPLWIKFHRDLLNDFSYSSVQIGTKATLPLLWLLACEYEDGIIDASLEEISFRIHIDIKTVDKAIGELLECKFFTIVEDCTELYKTVPREEKRREEKETEKSDIEKLKDKVVFKLSEYDNINKDAFKEWWKYKKFKNISPITKVLNMLNNFSYEDQQKMVDNSIMNSYAGLFELKNSTRQQPYNTPKSQKLNTDINIWDEIEKGNIQ